jgi:hypothetical protein
MRKMMGDGIRTIRGAEEDAMSSCGERLIENTPRIPCCMFFVATAYLPAEI